MALLQIAEPGRSAAPHQHKLAVGIDVGTTNSLVSGSLTRATLGSLYEDALLLSLLAFEVFLLGTAIITPPLNSYNIYLRFKRITKILYYKKINLSTLFFRAGNCFIFSLSLFAFFNMYILYSSSTIQKLRSHHL